MGALRFTAGAASIFGGTNRLVLEGGTVIFSILIAAVAFLPLLASSVDIFLRICGGRAVGQISEIGRRAARSWRQAVTFATPDGREICFHQPVTRPGRVGERLVVHYWRPRPRWATGRAAWDDAVRFVPSLIAMAIGLAGLAGTLYTAAAGGFGTCACRESYPRL